MGLGAHSPRHEVRILTSAKIVIFIFFVLTKLIIPQVKKVFTTLTTKVVRFVSEKMPQIYNILKTIFLYIRNLLKRLRDEIKDLYINLKNTIKVTFRKIAGLLFRKKKSRPTNASRQTRSNYTPAIIAAVVSVATTTLTLKGNYGVITPLIQLTLILVLVGLYQIFIFFKKMYETSKWTTEAARFTRILVQAFWILEIGTYAVFTYLVSIRPELNFYGFGNATAAAVSRLQALELLGIAASMVAVFLPIVIASQAKKKGNRAKVLILLTVAITVTSNTFYQEVCESQLAYT